MKWASEPDVEFRDDGLRRRAANGGSSSAFAEPPETTPGFRAIIGAWEKRAERIVYSGYRTIVTKTFVTPTGVQDFEIKSEPDAAVVFALTPDREVLLVREFRPGTEEWLLELPGGNVDDEEDADAAAARELLEETGFAVTLQYAGAEVDCAYSTRRCHVFVEEDAIRLRDSAEGLEVVLMALPEFRDHLRSGQFTDVGAGYRGLDALGLL